VVATDMMLKEQGLERSYRCPSCGANVSRLLIEKNDGTDEVQLRSCSGCLVQFVVVRVDAGKRKRTDKWST